MELLQVRPYPLTARVGESEFELWMPRGARILGLQNVLNDVYLWALVDPSKPPEARKFHVVMSGQHIQQSDLQMMTYIGTYLWEGGRIVRHVFEALNHG